MKLKQFFKALLELPDIHLQLLTERIEQVKRNREIRDNCIMASYMLGNIKHDDIIMARESLIKGDSIEAIIHLITYINKTSK